jgi:hypothetical protein
MNHREEAILLGVFCDLERYENMPSDPGYGTTSDRLRRRDARLGRVPIDPARWLRRAITPSESVMNSKAYSKLESRGLVVRIKGYAEKQTTHLRLTPAGRDAAQQIRDTLKCTEAKP